MPILGPVAVMVISRGIGTLDDARKLGIGAACAEGSYAGIAFGFATLFARYPAALPVSRVLASVVLLVVGASFVAYRPKPVDPSAAVGGRKAKSAFGLGLLTSGLNPTIVAMWTAVVAVIHSRQIVEMRSRRPRRRAGCWDRDWQPVLHAGRAHDALPLSTSRARDATFHSRDGSCAPGPRRVDLRLGDSMTSEAVLHPLDGESGLLVERYRRRRGRPVGARRPHAALPGQSRLSAGASASTWRGGDGGGRDASSPSQSPRRPSWCTWWRTPMAASSVST